MSGGLHSLSLKLPKKRPLSQTNIISNKVFEQDNGDEDENDKHRVYLSTGQGLLTQTTPESFDDPNIFAYDEVYEQLRNKERFQKGSERKSRYLASLKARAEERKMEQELIEERLSFREREKEEREGEFQDKEKFITTAYKEKMKRLKEWEEQRQKQQDSDATRGGRTQANMSRFYSSLFTRNVALGSVANEELETEKRQPIGETAEHKEFEDSRKQAILYEETEEQQRKKALFGEPEKRPGGLFIPSVRNSGPRKTEQNSTESATIDQVKSTVTRERKDEESVRKARERYLARKQQRVENGLQN